MDGTPDNRYSQRFVKVLSVLVSSAKSPYEGSHLHKGYEAIAENISIGGLYAELTIPENEFVKNILRGDFNISLVLKLTESRRELRVKALPIWVQDLGDPIEKKVGCGLKFVEMSDKDKDFLAKYLEEFSVKTSNQPCYTLLVNGEKIDTGIYEYFPYAEKSITDFKSTYKIIHALKKGEIPNNFKDYVYARYCVAAEDTNRKAIHAAYEAFQVYKKFDLEKRYKIVQDVHDLLVAHKKEFIELLVIEGHSIKLAEWEFSGMERCLNHNSLNFFKHEMWKKINHGDETIHIVRKPDGVVCISPPKNAASSNSLLCSLVFLSGNTVVIKPPLKMPISTIYLWENIIDRALQNNGAPRGCVNIVLGNSKKIMDEWLSSDLVSDIVYFGESETGLEIGKQAYLSNKKAILELSGNDILFVWKDADIGKAIASLIDSFLGSTQICMVPKNAVVHNDIFDEFLEKFVKEVQKLKVGLPSSKDTYLTPIMKPKDFFDFLDDAVTHGAMICCGGKRISFDGIEDKNGMYIQPTVVSIDDADIAKKTKVFKKENFFPLIPVIKVVGNDEIIFKKMLEISDENDYGLRTSVWVKSKVYMEKFLNEINNSGLLKINSRHVAFSVYASTHGGTRKTGGPYGEMNYIWQKTSRLQGIVVKD